MIWTYSENRREDDFFLFSFFFGSSDAVTAMAIIVVVVGLKTNSLCCQFVVIDGHPSIFFPTNSSELIRPMVWPLSHTIGSCRSGRAIFPSLFLFFSPCFFFISTTIWTAWRWWLPKRCMRPWQKKILLLLSFVCKWKKRRRKKEYDAYGRPPFLWYVWMCVVCICVYTRMLRAGWKLYIWRGQKSEVKFMGFAINALKGCWYMSSVGLSQCRDDFDFLLISHSIVLPGRARLCH